MFVVKDTSSGQTILFCELFRCRYLSEKPLRHKSHLSWCWFMIKELLVLAAWVFGSLMMPVLLT